MTQRVVFVESNTSGTGELFARRALELDLAVTVISADHSRYPLADIEGIDAINADTTDIAALAGVVRALGERDRDRPVRAVMSTSDYFVGVAAAVSEQLSLAGPSSRAIERCRDKTLQREILAAAGVSIPGFGAATSVGAALATAQRLGYPVVCKPAVGSGSYGVRLCAGEEELREHAQRLLGWPVNERGTPIKPEMLLEQLVAGDEYSVEIVDGAVQAIVRKRLGALPHFVEIGHDYPAQLPPHDAERLRAAARDAVDALALPGGPCHVEARLSGAVATIVEVNPRLAGGWIPVLVRRSGGPDLIAATIHAALGEPVPEPTAPATHGALRFVVARWPAVAGEPAQGLIGEHGAWEARMTAAPGTKLEPHNDFRDRVGHVLARGSSAAEAQVLAERQAARLAATLMPIRDRAETSVPEHALGART